MRDLILACWLSEQIEPAEMLRLCAADPELERLRAERLRLMGCARVEVKA